MKNTTETSALSLLANDAGYDPLEDRLRENIRSTIEAVFEEELAPFLGRCRYGREDALRQGYRNGHRERQLTGTFGTERVSVPRARIVEEDGRASEWRSRALPRYQRLTRKAEALIASVYLSGTNTRRVKRALFGLFRGAVSKDVVSRAWRKVKVDWDAWCSRGLADEDIVRLILDGTVIKTRLDRKATNISVLAAIGVRRDGQKVLLSIGNMGGESQAAWRQFLDDLDACGLKRPGFVIVDGAPGLEAALSALWGDDLPVQRCTVHKHRNLLGHAPKHMHDELSEDYRDMIYADTASEVKNPPQGVCPQVAAENAGPSRTASQKRATSSLPSRACPRANGNQPKRPTPLSVSTRSSSAGSKHRPCCRVPKQCRCSSGRSSLPAKSRCAKSMDGKPSIS